MERRNGDVAFGSMCRHRRLATDPFRRDRSSAAFSRAAARIGHPQIRNRGTFGGSLARTPDPSAELPAAVIALDGQIRLTGPWPSGPSRPSDFFSGFFTTTIGRGEVADRDNRPARGQVG